MTSQAEGALRAQTRAALNASGISQAEACRQLGLSTKHMSQMLSGVVPLSLMRAEQILALCGLRPVIAIEYVKPKEVTP